ncbi:signal peptidase I [Actinacidiphila acididurans]|uniref:Signal peptidase I n=1 Tax=Actinacidiphila acididurans TaxID=2784346 RepID=A0ABS2TKS5_9ACTN|nr:signal peptidase I [Actinacidiphila acididurans]MBM9503925.1 signal peptidase I [Actinacidiphila acididurans]
MSATSSSTGAIRGVTGKDGGAGGGGRLGHTLSGVAVALGCVLFLGGFGWAALTYRPYTVPTDSMRPTVQPGSKVLARHVSGSAVHRGDVVVFKDPQWGDLPEVKRVVAVGGDKVACCDKQGRLTVDGTSVTEPYLNKGGGPASMDAFHTTVPKGSLFLLGDNRIVSQDSRIRLDDGAGGSVPAKDVKGRVEATAWPLGRMGMISRTGAFDALTGGGASGAGPLPWQVIMVIAGAVLIFGGAAYGPVARLVGRRR